MLRGRRGKIRGKKESDNAGKNEIVMRRDVMERGAEHGLGQQGTAESERWGQDATWPIPPRRMEDASSSE
eukprot:2889017-Rhodomonas_salina.1